MIVRRFKNSHSELERLFVSDGNPGDRLDDPAEYPCRRHLEAQELRAAFRHRRCADVLLLLRHSCPHPPGRLGPADGPVQIRRPVLPERRPQEERQLRTDRVSARTRTVNK